MSVTGLPITEKQVVECFGSVSQRLRVIPAALVGDDQYGVQS